MTREEAKSIILKEAECVTRQGKTGQCCRDELGCGACPLVMEDVKILEAYLMACKALEEPKQEELTLEKAIDYLTEIGWLPNHDRELTEPKQGEWIVHSDKIGLSVECPFCHKEMAGDDLNFCCKCGADMRVKDELNRVSKELNSEIEKSKGKILPDYCDGLLYSMTNGDNFIGKEGDEK